MTAVATPTPRKRFSATPLRSKLAVPLLAVVLAASACGSDAEPVTASSPTTAPSTSLPDEQIPVEPDGGIGDTPLGEVPFFGGNDDQCPSTVLANEDDDQAKIAAGAECFIGEVEAGVPVVWDLNQPTVEGDPIYIRHLFDGESIWILRDDRADEYGSDSLSSQRCEGATAGRWGLEGVSCEEADYPAFTGFPEAE